MSRQAAFAANAATAPLRRGRLFVQVVLTIGLTRRRPGESRSGLLQWKINDRSGAEIVGGGDRLLVADSVSPRSAPQGAGRDNPTDGRVSAVDEHGDLLQRTRLQPEAALAGRPLSGESKQVGQSGFRR